MSQPIFEKGHLPSSYKCYGLHQLVGSSRWHTLLPLWFKGLNCGVRIMNHFITSKGKADYGKIHICLGVSHNGYFHFWWKLSYWCQSTHAVSVTSQCWPEYHVWTLIPLLHKPPIEFNIYGQSTTNHIPLKLNLTCRIFQDTGANTMEYFKAQLYTRTCTNHHL
jgi:hypothetical protein